MIPEVMNCPACKTPAVGSKVASVCRSCGCPVQLHFLADLMLCEELKSLVPDEYRSAFQLFYSDLHQAVRLLATLVETGEAGELDSYVQAMDQHLAAAFEKVSFDEYQGTLLLRTLIHLPASETALFARLLARISGNQIWRSSVDDPERVGAMESLGYLAEEARHMCFLLGITLESEARLAATDRFARAKGGPLKWLNAPIENNATEADASEQLSARAASEEAVGHGPTQHSAGNEESPPGEPPLFDDSREDDDVECPTCQTIARGPALTSLCEVCGCPIHLYPLAEQIFCEGTQELVPEDYKRAFRPFYVDFIAAVLSARRLLDASGRDARADAVNRARVLEYLSSCEAALEKAKAILRIGAHTPSLLMRTLYFLPASQLDDVLNLLEMMRKHEMGKMEADDPVRRIVADTLHLLSVQASNMCFLLGAELTEGVDAAAARRFAAAPTEPLSWLAKPLDHTGVLAGPVGGTGSGEARPPATKAPPGGLVVRLPIDLLLTPTGWVALAGIVFAVRGDNLWMIPIVIACRAATSSTQLKMEAEARAGDLSGTPATGANMAATFATWIASLASFLLA